MATVAANLISISVSVLLMLCSLSPLINSSAEAEGEPSPAPWPHQFHSILFMNYSGILQKIDLWYDWPKGRNFNIVQHQLGKVLYDLEWNNGTSFFYTLDANKECSSAQLEVGILRPNWLDGAKYLGQRHVDGFLCNVWEKVDFIWYYEDVVTKRPVHWVFYTGREAHVMTFEVGAALEDAKWQAPVYCFDNKNSSTVPPQDGLLRACSYSYHCAEICTTTMLGIIIAACVLGLLALAFLILFAENSGAFSSFHKVRENGEGKEESKRYSRNQEKKNSYECENAEVNFC